MDIQIKTSALTKQYKMGTQTVDALKGVDLEIEKGSFTAVCGTSGSGKSTLLHMLGCLDKATSGDVFIGDINVTGTKDKKLAKIRRENIGFVFQKFCLIPELSVTENIIVPVLLSGKLVQILRILTSCVRYSGSRTENLICPRSFRVVSSRDVQ